MRKIFILYLLMLSHLVYSQKLEFGFGIGGVSGDGGKDITLDQNNNIYLLGYFNDSVDFDPSANVNNQYSVNPAIGSDIFLSKYDDQGKYYWSLSFGGNNTLIVDKIKIDDSSNVYIIGEFWGRTDFQPGPDSNIIYPVGQSDIFFSKFDMNGNYKWTKVLGAFGPDRVYDLEFDDSSNFILTGSFAYTIDFDPDTGVFNMVANYLGHGFFAKYTSDGKFLWAKEITGSNYAVRITSLDRYKNGDLAMIGSCSNCDFDTDTSNYFIANSVSFFVRYSPEGKLKWVRTIPHSSNGGPPYFFDLIINNNEESFIYGNYTGTCDFNPGTNVNLLTAVDQSDIFLAKYDSIGDYKWAFSLGDIAHDNYSKITLDAQENVNIVGMVHGDIDFDPGPGVALELGNGNDNGFWAKYKPDGTFVNVMRFNTDSRNYLSSLAIDGNFNLYITGAFYDSLDVDPSTLKSMISSKGIDDILLVKYSQCIEAEVDSVVSDPLPQCKGDEVTLKLENSFLYGAMGWKWYSDSCGGNLLGNGDSLQLVIDSNISIFIRGEGGCVVAPFCDSILLIPNDTKAPDLTCPTDSTFIIPESESIYLVKSLNANAIDNCSEVDLSWTMSGATTGSGSGNINNYIFNLGTTKVSFSAIDTSLNQSNCSFNINVSHPTGINNLDLFSIKIFPNPSNGTFRIQNAPIENLEVRDLLGRSIDFTLTQKINFEELTINSSSGIYLVFIYSGNEKTVKRLVVD